MVHLMEKPVELAARAIQYSCRPGENILNLSGGSGSTLRLRADGEGRLRGTQVADAYPRCRWGHGTRLDVTQLLRASQVVFAPIVHSHPLVAYGLPPDCAFWQRVDVDHVRRCNEVVVLMLHGWDRSAGVREVVRAARALGTPVRYIAAGAAVEPRAACHSMSHPSSRRLQLGAGHVEHDIHLGLPRPNTISDPFRSADPEDRGVNVDPAECRKLRRCFKYVFQRLDVLHRQLDVTLRGQQLTDDRDSTNSSGNVAVSDDVHSCARAFHLAAKLLRNCVLRVDPQTKQRNAQEQQGHRTLQEASSPHNRWLSKRHGESSVALRETSQAPPPATGRLSDASPRRATPPSGARCHLELRGRLTSQPRHASPSVAHVAAGADGAYVRSASVPTKTCCCRCRG